MKKLLLFGTLAMAAASMSAASNEYFKVTYEGKEVNNNDLIYCSHTLGGALPGEDNYSADIEFASLEGELVLIVSVNPDTQQPGYNGDNWGFPQVCEADGNCFPTRDQYIASLDEEGFMWMIEATSVFDNAEPVYVIDVMAAYGEPADYELIDDSVMQFKIKYTKSDAFVKGIESDSNEAPIYYNLLGKRVTNPTNGVYIVKQGKKVTKKVFGN